jgi:tetratricopeptide (TPR) repeat protein
VLYTLLTGHPPLERGNWPEMQQRIQRGDFPRPRQVRPGVPRALEAVCLKAMALEPGARYPSAEVLARDVEHWLADEPVTAWREPLPARARRWGRRHRTLVSALAVLLLTLLAVAGVGLVALGQKNRQVAAAEREAARKAAQAEAVNAFLTDDLLGQANPDVNAHEKKVTVEELLRRAAGKIDGNPKFADQPEVEASLRLTMGQTYWRLGELSEGARHLRRAVELRRAALGPEAPLTLDAQQKLADLLCEQGDLEEAEPLSRQTWEARARVLGPENPDTLESLKNCGRALVARGEYDRGETLLRQCYEAQCRVVGEATPGTLDTLNSLGWVLMQQGKWGEAERVQDRELDLKRGTMPPGVEPLVAAINNLALSLCKLRRLGEAEKLLRAGLDDARRVQGPTSFYTHYVQHMLAWVLVEEGQYKEAEGLASETMDRRRELLGRRDPLVSRTQAVLGRAMMGQGRAKDAVRLLEEAVGILEKAPPTQRYWAADAEDWLGVALGQLGKHQEAEKRLLASHDKMQADPRVTPFERARCVEHLVGLYEAWGQPAKAARWRKELEAAGPPAGKPGRP